MTSAFSTSEKLPKIGEETVLEFHKVRSIDPPESTVHVASSNVAVNQLRERPFAVDPREVREEGVGLQICELRRGRLQVAEARRMESRQREEMARIGVLHEILVLSLVEMALSECARLEPLRQSFVEPCRVRERGPRHIEGGVNELVVEHVDQSPVDQRVSANTDYAPVEARRWKAEQPGKGLIEDGRVVHYDLDLARRAQVQVVVEARVGLLENLEHLLLEAPRTAQAAGLVDVDVLEQNEVRGVSRIELSVGTSIEGPCRMNDGEQQRGDRNSRVSPVDIESPEKCDRKPRARPVKSSLRRQRVNHRAAPSSSRRSTSSPRSRE